MKYAGIDLHKKTISVCVMDKDRKILVRRQLSCADVERMCEFFRQLGPFQAAVEATASYEWLVQLLDPLAQRVVLVHPKKLRVIAESVRKTDKIDAEVLAEFLARDMLPQAYRPTPRQREHRALVRHRHSIQGKITSVRCRVRRILSNYNADRPNLFTAAGLEYLRALDVLAADRLVLNQLIEEWQQHRRRLREADKP